ncbi:BrnT family toxin [Myxococcota bacterium]|nr:BrnT family toxin [Myxococcota bacterium]
MSLTFEWDDTKARMNVRKHGITFEEAATAFGDPLSVTIEDPDHSSDEARFLLLGATYAGQIVVVAHAERGDSIRIISARKATPAEKRDHERE